jgi:soluble lytic murein transglycosylase-like protein
MNFSFAQQNKDFISKEEIVKLKEEKTQFEYLNIQGESNKLEDFGYNEITQYLEQKEKNKHIQVLSKHISTKYKLNFQHAEHIVKTTFTEAEKHEIEPVLMLSIIGIESTFKLKALSPVGAVGLAQIMPQFHINKINMLKKENLDIYSIQGNIRVGIQILKEYIDLANGNVQEALQRYNGSYSDKNKSYSKKVFSKMKNLKSVASIKT